jgi:hypothetical protein
MTNNHLKALASVLHMIVETDKFHLEVAKALLSSEPLSEQQKAELRGRIATRESRHEQQEKLIADAARLLSS